jgi:nicotinamidase/pyrazinamidase
MIEGDRAGLLIVDVQNDFCSGALPVPDADRVVNALNRYIDDAVARGATVYASRDWHPAVTTHFKPYGGPWPAHCVQDTDGAGFQPNLRLPSTAIVITNGESPDSPGYSAFEGRTPDGNPLLADLRERGIRHLYVGGLATDYCVKHSVLDALSAGLSVTVLEDAIAGVERENSARAIVEMRERGAHVATGAEMLVSNGVSRADYGVAGCRANPEAEMWAR